MLSLISPAKKLLSIKSAYHSTHSLPIFLNHANEIAAIMKNQSVDDLADLMNLSQNLALLNFERYQHFNMNHSKDAPCWPAVYLFQGDVYQSLDAKSLNDVEINYLQNHAMILSGLYGLLRPLDLIQPYRLEMGTKLNNPKGNDLYAFWRPVLTQHINEMLAIQAQPVLINLASGEYFSSIDTSELAYPYIQIDFLEEKNGTRKNIGIHAKRARGLMLRYMALHQIDNPNDIKKFDSAGYRYCDASSQDSHFIFVRS